MYYQEKSILDSQVSHNLGHSVSNVEGGTEVTSDEPATSNKGVLVFHGRDRAPLHVRRDIAVKYNSVYKRDRRVLRAITDREMMEVYDLEIPTQGSLEKF